MGCTTCERKQENGATTISSYEQFYEAIVQGAKLMVLEDTVLDVSNFLKIHARGTETIAPYVGNSPTEILGYEVARFFYGGFYLTGIPAHDHSEAALKLAATMKVGTIKEPLQQRLFLPLKSPLSLPREEEKWKLVGKAELSGAHGRFEFRNENYKVAGMLPYFSHCGKYYALHSKHLNLTRNVACTFTLSKLLLDHYTALLNAFRDNQPYESPFSDIHNVTKEGVEVYVKRLNKFSSFLHDFPYGNEEANDFRLRGPFLTDPSFKLVLFSSFRQESSVLGEGLFKALHDLSAKYHFNNFEYFLRVSGKPDTFKWDEAYFKERVDIRAARVLINGPYGAAPQLKATLQKIGITDSQFHWL